MEIRTLRADEIECRVQQVKGNGCVLLLYKDARCDMRILDEVFGIDGWEREHTVVNGNLFCTVRIWSDKRNCWISKQDVGTESNTEKQKGEASDSFKRACFNIGIGRELYSSPFTWINLKADEIDNKNGKYSLNYKIKFRVSEIEYSANREISKLVIVDQNNKVRFDYKNGKSSYIKNEKDRLDIMYEIANNAGVTKEKVDESIMKVFKKEADKLTDEEYNRVVDGYRAKANA